MQNVSMRRTAVLAVLGMIAAAVAVLNFGGPPIQAAPGECREDGQSPSPTSSGSPSTSGSPSGTNSPGPTPSQSSGGIIPTLPIPTGSASPSGSASPTPSDSSPSGQPPSRCESTISIGFVERYSNQDRRSAFKGRVRSADSLCERGRRVNLKKKTATGSRSAGRTLTNRRGEWRIFKDDPKGRYFASTPEDSRASDHGEHICEAARSRTIRP